jgi:hypothetical protein
VVDGYSRCSLEVVSGERPTRTGLEVFLEGRCALLVGELDAYMQLPWAVLPRVGTASALCAAIRARTSRVDPT